MIGLPFSHEFLLMELSDVRGRVSGVTPGSCQFELGAGCLEPSHFCKFQWGSSTVPVLWNVTIGCGGFAFSWSARPPIPVLAASVSVEPTIWAAVESSLLTHYQRFCILLSLKALCLPRLTSSSQLVPGRCVSGRSPFYIKPPSWLDWEAIWPQCRCQDSTSLWRFFD